MKISSFTVIVMLLAAAALPARSEPVDGSMRQHLQLAQRATTRGKTAKSGKSSVDQNQMRIAAVVNNEVITVRDLVIRLNFVIVTSRLPNRPDVRKRLAPQILRSLIEERLKLQEAKRLGLKVSNKEIQAALRRIEKANNIPQGKLMSVMARQGTDASTMIEQITSALAWSKVVVRKIRPRIRISNEEVLAFIERARSARGRTRYRVYEIFLAVDTPDQDNQVLKAAQRLFEQIKIGSSFTQIARQFSQSATASVGGDLGWIELGSLPKKLDVRLSQMKTGQVAGPIRTVEGYYIIALRDRKVIAAANPASVVVSLTQVTLRFPPKASEVDKNIQRSLAKTISETASSCADMEKLSKEIGATGAARLKNVKVVSLSAPLQKPARSLEIGKASAPIESKNGIVILMVCKRIGDANLPKPSEVRTQIGVRRLNILTRRYLRNLRRSAYLDLRV
ncbi:MAG: peptidylprolyl isomerase [Alphaproteobacteria bacterium]|nr:peptidylprolyl isomerase [Alphaproteobacteria bacterium]